MPKGERPTARPYLRGKVWWVQHYPNGRRLRESVHTTNKTIAERFLNHRKAESDGRRIVATEAAVSNLLDPLLGAHRHPGRASLKSHALDRWSV